MRAVGLWKRMQGDEFNGESKGCEGLGSPVTETGIYPEGKGGQGRILGRGMKQPVL